MSWTLKAVRASAPGELATSETDVAMVQSVFTDFTPADAIYAALMVNGYNGELYPSQFIATTETIPNLTSTRALFLMDA